MKICRRLFLVVFVMIWSCSSDDDPIIFNDDQSTSEFKIIGYLPTYRFGSAHQIEFCKITHLNLSFANPDSNGNIEMADVSNVIELARAQNPSIQIYISVAGGGLTSEQGDYWSNLIDNASNRPAFIEKIVSYVVANDFDGVDVDLEWGHVTSGYSPFVLELDAALTAERKSLSAALPNSFKFDNITNAALDAFDFINIMAYDATGPWRPESPGHHSTYNFAQEGVNYWKNRIGIDAERLALGVPFYGYTFTSPTEASAFTYASMVELNPNNADLDQIGNSYYNGRPTIRKKVNYAVNNVGGVMIWELGQDSFTEYSLLKTVHEEVQTLVDGFSTGCN